MRLPIRFLLFINIAMLSALLHSLSDHDSLKKQLEKQIPAQEQLGKEAIITENDLADSLLVIN